MYVCIAEVWSPSLFLLPPILTNISVIKKSLWLTINYATATGSTTSLTEVDNSTYSQSPTATNDSQLIPPSPLI